MTLLTASAFSAPGKSQIIVSVGAGGRVVVTSIVDVTVFVGGRVVLNTTQKSGLNINQQWSAMGSYRY
jgi:hypothetical protein